MHAQEHTWNDDHSTSFDERDMVWERHAPADEGTKQTFYIDDIQIISPTSALMTYVSAVSRDAPGAGWFGRSPPSANARAKINVYVVLDMLHRSPQS